jgi:hypothetical protein
MKYYLHVTIWFNIKLYVEAKAPAAQSVICSTSALEPWVYPSIYGFTALCWTLAAFEAS